MWKLGVPKELGVDHNYLRYVTLSKKRPLKTPKETYKDTKGAGC
jgi:hypothetical protein